MTRKLATLTVAAVCIILSSTPLLAFVPSGRPRLVELPNFPTELDFVHFDGTTARINIALMKRYLTQKTIAWILEENLQQLQVRGAYINKAQLQETNGGFMVPVRVGVRYQKMRWLVEGTLDGVFHVVWRNGVPTARLVSVQNRRPWQVFGQGLWRMTSNFHADEFVNQVAGDVLTYFFRQRVSLDWLETQLPR